MATAGRLPFSASQQGLSANSKIHIAYPVLVEYLLDGRQFSILSDVVRYDLMGGLGDKKASVSRQSGLLD